MKKLCLHLFVIFSIFIIVLPLVSCISTSEAASAEVEKKEITEITETPEVKKPASFEIGFAEKLQALLQEGKREEAIALFDELPSKHAKNIDLQILLGSLLISSGRLDEAAVQVDKLMAKAPENEDVLMLSVMLSKASGNKEKKSEVLKQLLEVNPYQSEANVELAKEQMLRRNYELAKKYYERGLSGDPKNIDALSGYGQTLYYIGKNDNLSKQTFMKVLELDPENSFAYSFLGKLAAEEANYKVATEYIEKAIEIDANVYDYWLDYGQYLRSQGDFDKTEEAWLKAKDLQPDYFLSYAYLAGLYDEQNKFDDALEMYRKVLELNPKYYFAYESLGMFAWHQGQYSEARKGFEKAYIANPQNISYPLMIAATYLKEKKQKEAKDFLGKVLRNRDSSTVEYAVLRLYYDKLNESQVAQKVMNTNERNLRGKMMYYLGLFYEINGNDVLSEKYYTDVLNLNSPMFFEFRLAEWAMQVNEK
ncbi:MAG: tetratricopeptide repeat protein [Spirochaetaceae bacterium]|nr:tetratricopeptide repeat protein [Spirochaetaceae bacterium]